MKTIVALCALLVALIAQSQAISPMATGSLIAAGVGPLRIIQHKYCSGLGTTCAFTSTPTAGNVLLAYAAKETNSYPTMTTTTGGNTWFKNIVPGAFSGNFLGYDFSFCPNATGGAAETLTFNTTGDYILVEVAGTDPLFAMDFNPPAGGNIGHNVSSPMTSSPWSATFSGELAIWFAASEFGGGTLSVPTSFTALDGGVDGQLTMTTAYQTGIAAGSYAGVSTTYTGSNLRDGGSMVITLRPPNIVVNPMINFTYKGGASVTTATFSSANTAGNAIVAVIYNENSSVATITGSSNGNTYTQICTTGTTFLNMRMYYAQNINAGIDTITLSAAANTVLLMEFTHVPTTAVLNTNTTCATNTELTGSMTTTANATLLTIYAYEYQGNGTMTGTSGWATRQIGIYPFQWGQIQFLVQEQDNVAAGAYTNTLTNNANGSYFRTRTIGAIALKWQ